MNNLLNYKKNITSQWGEDGIIEEIFNRISSKTKICVEFGAWDGKHLSNTWNLCFNKGWRGVLIEGDANRTDELRVNCKGKKIDVVNAFVEPVGENSIDSIIDKIGDIKQVDLMSVDIDGNEYQILENISKYKPRVLIIEYNPTFPPHARIIQDLNQYMGSSSLAICELAEKRGYSLIAITDTNLFFIIKEEFYLLKIPEQKLKDIFSWNHVNYLVSTYDGVPFLIGKPPYLSLLPNKYCSKSIKKTRIPKFSSNVPLLPVFISGTISYISCLLSKIKNKIKKITNITVS